MTDLSKMSAEELMNLFVRIVDITDGPLGACNKYVLYKAELIRRLDEAESLRCCGNCKYYKVYNIDSFCEIDGEPVNPHKRCSVDHWQSDSITKEERMK